MIEYTVPLVSPEVFQFNNNDDLFYPPNGVDPFHPDSGVTGGTDALDDSDDGTFAQMVVRSERYGTSQFAQARWVVDGVTTQMDLAGVPTSGLLGGTVFLRVSWDGLAGQEKYLQVVGHDAANRAAIHVDPPYYPLGVVGVDGSLGNPASGGPALVSIPFAEVPSAEGPLDDLSIVERIAIYPTAVRFTSPPFIIQSADEYYRVHEAWIVFQFDEAAPVEPTVRVTRQYPRDDQYGSMGAGRRLVPPPRRGRIVGGQT